MKVVGQNGGVLNRGNPKGSGAFPLGGDPHGVGDGQYPWPRSNVVSSTSYYCDDNYMDDVDYCVVMVYVNQYWFDTFACLD
jgi:hypothetical protein